MRLVFAGTPEVALPALEALAASSHDVVAVVTRPPAPQGRSRRPVQSAVHEWGLAHGLEVLTPEHPRQPDFRARLAEIAPDCCPVVAYGALVPPRVLAIPERGWVNLHFSLLPAYRGAAPVQGALLAGEARTGATVFSLVPELDAGPVYDSIVEPIGPHDTAGDLLGRLALSGAALLVGVLDDIAAGARPVPQPHDGVSLAPKIHPADVRISWTDPADTIDRLVRAANPEPGAWTTLAGDRFRVLLAAPTQITATSPEATMGGTPSETRDLAPGGIAARRTEVRVGTGTTPLRLVTVQPLGKLPMAAADWARGARLAGGEFFA